MVYFYVCWYTDINECALLSGSCDENALCTNIEGSYECKYKYGFQSDVYTNCTGNKYIEHVSLCAELEMEIAKQMKQQAFKW